MYGRVGQDVGLGVQGVGWGVQVDVRVYVCFQLVTSCERGGGVCMLSEVDVDKSLGC